MIPLFAAVTVDGVLATGAYALLGAVMLVIGCVIVDLLTPGKLFELLRDGSPNAAAVIVANQFSIAAIVFAAGITSSDSTGSGLASMAVYGGVGIVAQAVLVLFIDNLLRFDWAELLQAPKLQPAGVVAASSSMALGAIMVVAVV